MIITEKATKYDGCVILGGDFLPEDEDSAQAVYERHGRTCGVTYESGVIHAYLRCTPGYQIPKFARDGDGWKRFVWELDDDRAVQVRLDERDGELTYTLRNDDLDDNLEDAIDECLEFLLGEDFYNKVLEFVRSKME